MKSEKPQKMIIPCIINILKEYTDENNKMKQEEIGKKLQSNYGIEVDRKTLSRNLRTILDNIDEVNCEVVDRKGRLLSEDEDDFGAIYTNFHYEHLFTNAEIQAIVNNIVFAKHISRHHKEDLIKKLESLVPRSVRHDLKNYIRDDVKYANEYENLFYNLELLDEAISAKEIVRFQCVSYNEKIKPQIEARIWYVFPLGIAEKDNDYYLVGLVCGSKNESPEELLNDVRVLIDNKERGSRFLDTFRIDKICKLTKIEEDDDEIQLSVADRKIAKKISMSSFNRTWTSIQDYVSQNSSLCPGRNITAKFKMINEKDGISDAIDYFGKENIRIEKSTDKSNENLYLLTVNTNDCSVLEYAKINASRVEVISPDYLRNELLDLFKEAYKRLEKF